MITRSWIDVWTDVFSFNHKKVHRPCIIHILPVSCSKNTYNAPYLDDEGTSMKEMIMLADDITYFSYARYLHFHGELLRQIKFSLR